eukprot:994629-Lingulodinium_polyedra.AAC.1
MEVDLGQAAGTEPEAEAADPEADVGAQGAEDNEELLKDIKGCLDMVQEDTDVEQGKAKAGQAVL